MKDKIFWFLFGGIIGGMIFNPFPQNSASHSTKQALVDAVETYLIVFYETWEPIMIKGQVGKHCINHIDFLIKNSDFLIDEFVMQHYEVVMARLEIVGDDKLLFSEVRNLILGWFRRNGVVRKEKESFVFERN